MGGIITLIYGSELNVSGSGIVTSNISHKTYSIVELSNLDYLYSAIICSIADNTLRESSVQYVLFLHHGLQFTNHTWILDSKIPRLDSNFELAPATRLI